MPLLSEQVKGIEESAGKRAVKAPQPSHDKDSLQENVANKSVKSPVPEGRGNRSTSTPTAKLTQRSIGIQATPKDSSVYGKGIIGGVNGIANSSLGGKPGSPKMSIKSGFVQPQLSATSVTPPADLAKGDVKKDKRQWALEVLARKTGSTSNGSSNTPGSANARGCSDNGEGQFALLVTVILQVLILQNVSFA